MQSSLNKISLNRHTTISQFLDFGGLFWFLIFRNKKKSEWSYFGDHKVNENWYESMDLGGRAWMDLLGSFWILEFLERFLESEWSHFGGSESWRKLNKGIFLHFLHFGWIFYGFCIFWKGFYLKSEWSHYWLSESWRKLTWYLFPWFFRFWGVFFGFWIFFGIIIVIFWGVRKLKHVDRTDLEDLAII